MQTLVRRERPGVGHAAGARRVGGRRDARLVGLPVRRRAARRSTRSRRPARPSSARCRRRPPTRRSRSVGGTAYVIGGYTGSERAEHDRRLHAGQRRRRSSRRCRSTLRFAAATTLGGEVYIAGGETQRRRRARRSTGSTRRPRRVTTFAQLPNARDREAAATLAGRIVVIGGANTTTGLRTRAIYVDQPAQRRRAPRRPAAGRAVGHAPRSRGRGEIIVAGGIDGTGAATAGDLRDHGEAR